MAPRQTDPIVIRILVADDHPLILMGVRSVLSSLTRFKIVGDALGPESLFARLADVGCDVLITDFHMPEERVSDGLAMLGVIRRKFPEVKTIVLTGLANPALMNSMLQEGVMGVLNKRSDMGELPAAIDLASKDKIYLGKATQKEMARLGDARAPGMPARALSPSELEVIRLYASGLPVSGIAVQLRRSIKTISTHKRSAMEKLGLRSDAELCRYAAGNGLG
ncbi:response regulator transcription factor [Cupriavidus pauculus]|uniref:response regulator transcription factor n=1 Tax=Cupriavidus pauculus TaxID=82633 RepID=UPI00078652B9|nr:response regulator transcription factor [Cupriavidus pauculus]